MSPEPTQLSVPTVRSKTRKIAAPCILLAVFAMVFLGIRWSAHHSSNPPLNAFAAKGREAPNFALSTPEGNIVRLADFRGRAVLINFFGTTCVPCRQESPYLVEMQKKNAAKGFEIIGIEMYGSSNNDIKKFRGDFGTNYVMVRGDNTVGDQYGVGELPVSYFLNARGTIVAATVGLRPEKEMDDHLEAALRGD
jgi:thiol-disulfide isomerase/thioredoxin